MRKREERFNWLSYTPAQQLHVIKLCRQRYRRKVLAGKGKTELPQDDASPQQDLMPHRNKICSSYSSYRSRFITIPGPV